MNETNTADSALEARLQVYAIDLAEHGAGDEDRCRDCMDVLKKVWREASAQATEAAAKDAEFFRDRYDALCDALKTHSGDTDGFEFGLVRVRWDERGQPAEVYWASQIDIIAAIDAAIRSHPIGEAAPETKGSTHG